MAIYSWKGKEPVVGEGCFIAPTATVIGDVRLGDGANVLFGVVLRGDVGPLIVGDRSNIQDGAVLHTDEGIRCEIGIAVTVGHGAIVHGACVEDGALIGMGAVVLNGARIGAGAMVGAGALVKENDVIPAGMLAVGVPAKVIRPVTDQERQRVMGGALLYERLRDEYRRMF